jgi:hypothetical protein
VEEPPELSELGLAWMLTAGGSVLTVTVTDWLAEPPGPTQVSSYSVLLDRVPVDNVPLIATGPCHPPLALHTSALLAVQVRVELSRLLIVVGEAARVTVGAGSLTMTCFDSAVAPPEPVHVSV